MRCCVKQPPCVCTSAVINHQPLFTLKWLKWIISCVQRFFSLSEFMFTVNRSGNIAVSYAVFGLWFFFKSLSVEHHKWILLHFWQKNFSALLDICISFFYRSSCSPVLARDLLSLSRLPSWTLAAFPCWLMSQGLYSCQTTPQSQPDSLLKRWALLWQKGRIASVLFL